MKQLIVIGFLLCAPFFVVAQSAEHELANLYYNSGEFDKALGYYEKFYNDTKEYIYLQRYVDCLVNTNNGKEAEKVLQKHIKKNPNDYLIAVYLGRVYEDDNRKEDAQKHYQNR